MNHQPFEEWLLTDKFLTPAEKRELDLHLRTCADCTALSATGLALRSARAARPAAGFTLRFQQKLAAQKALERRRRLLGMVSLVFSSAVLLAWLAFPYLNALIVAPTEWLTTLTGYLLYVTTSIRALGDASLVLLRVIPDLLPPYAWMALASTVAGLSLLSSVSIWRFIRLPQGAVS
ncbi:MAG: zf-HC2 domain-containing protein [Anaerolineales bacterium]|nr:zf-HC2 domain-containing protein [Anaerolineales bacterium]